MACHEEIVGIADEVKPDQATIVPERREEVTTEGGLDVASAQTAVERVLKRLQDAGIYVSLFLDPDPRQLDVAAEIGAQAVELHTGAYALAREVDRPAELAKLVAGGRQIRERGMALHAGHGLNYHNVLPVAAIPDMHELNIGHAIVARAVMIGMERAVREMKELLARITAV
jgi:pyridoxine 5-phosphate synthase